MADAWEPAPSDSRRSLRAVDGDTWLPVATLLIGFVLAEITTERKDRRRVKQERKQRQADFQRETLLALQDVLFRLQRSESQVHRVKEQASQPGIGWRQREVPVEFDEENRLARAEAYLLKVRVEDDKVRELTNAVTSSEVMVAFAETPIDAAAAVIAAGVAFDDLNDRIGLLLRGD